MQFAGRSDRKVLRRGKMRLYDRIILLRACKILDHFRILAHGFAIISSVALRGQGVAHSDSDIWSSFHLQLLFCIASP